MIHCSSVGGYFLIVFYNIFLYQLEEYATDGIEKGIADYFNSSEYKKIMNKLQSEVCLLSVCM